MRHETQQLLSGEDPPEQTVHEEGAQASHSHECGKKHGIFCRIMTTLHFKIKGSERQKLISESQEHLPYQDNHSMQPQLSKKSNKKAKKEKSDKTNESEKSPSSNAPLGIPRRKSTLSRNRNNNNNFFSTTYEMLDNEFHHSGKFLLEPKKQSTSPAEQVMETVEHVTMQNVHTYGEEHFEDSYISKIEDNSPKDESKSQGTGQYLKQKWQGRRAKMAKKRIRRAMRATLLSLQSATNASTAFPSPHTVVSAMSASGRR